MPADGLTFRTAEEHELPRVLEILQASSGRWPAFEIGVPGLDYLRWKASSPGLDSRRLVFERSRIIVGTVLATKRRYLLHGERVHAVDWADLAVDPVYQGRGVYSAFLAWKAAALAGCELDLGVTGQPVVARARALQGARPLANHLQVLRSLLALGSVGNPFRGRPAWTVRDATRFDERVDGLFEAAAAEFDFVQVRSRDYLDWRYRDPRAGSFALAIAEEGEQLLGYAVTVAGSIVDLLALPGRLDVVRSLLAAAASRLRADGAGSARAWLPHRHPYRGAFRRSGFVGLRKAADFTYLPFEIDPGRLGVLADRHGAVHLMLGDTDWV